MAEQQGTREEWQERVDKDFAQMRRVLDRYEQLLGKLHPREAYTHYRGMMEVMCERLVDRATAITEHQIAGDEILKQL